MQLCSSLFVYKVTPPNKLSMLVVKEELREYTTNISGAETREKGLSNEMNFSCLKCKRTMVQSSRRKLIDETAAKEDSASIGELRAKFDLLSLKKERLNELNQEIGQLIEEEVLNEEAARSESYTGKNHRSEEPSKKLVKKSEVGH